MTRDAMFINDMQLCISAMAMIATSSTNQRIKITLPYFRVDTNHNASVMQRVEILKRMQ